MAIRTQHPTASVQDLGKRTETVGRTLTRYGLVLVLLWIGAMKFTAYEASAIQGPVASSPFLGWLYAVFSVQTVRNLIGVSEIVTALLLALHPVSARLGAAGGLLASAIFLVTLSFLFSAPGWEPSLGGFPALSGLPGQFIIKNVVLLGASVMFLGESLRAL